MPHITVEMLPGRSEEVKETLADRLSVTAAECVKVDPSDVSVSIREISSELWKKTVYDRVMLKELDLYRYPKKMENTEQKMSAHHFAIRLALPEDRSKIYQLRYKVYTEELRQHPETEEKSISDPLDAFNEYLLCMDGTDIAGFVSITPPGEQLSLDKYRNRDTLGFLYTNAYEVRILTVLPQYRGLGLADRLLRAAARYVIQHGGALILAIGRENLIDYYRSRGFVTVNEQYQSGKVAFRLMFTMPNELVAKTSSLN